jgi:hypothetical protein
MQGRASFTSPDFQVPCGACGADEEGAPVDLPAKEQQTFEPVCTHLSMFWLCLPWLTGDRKGTQETSAKVVALRIRPSHTLRTLWTPLESA